MTTTPNIPESIESDWQEYATQLRREILAGECSEEEADYAIGQFKRLYMECGMRPFNKLLLSGDPETVAEDVQTWVHATFSIFTTQLIVRDVELFKHRGPNSPI